MTENTAPALQQTMYYSKAVSSLCRSASRFQQAAKRKTILEMISQERERREHVEQLRQEHMGSIFKSKSNSRLDLAETQSSARRELEALRDRNSLMRKLCRRSIEESRLTDFKRKRESADSVRALLESSHHWRDLCRSRQLKESFVNAQEHYRLGKQATRNRRLANESFRESVLRQNDCESQLMLKRARKYESLIEDMTTEMSQSGFE